MAVITTGGGTGVTVDGTSNAARVTLYDSAGNELGRPATTAYICNFSIRQTSTTTASLAAGTVFSMRIPSGTVLGYVRWIRGICTFDGSAAVTTTQKYGFYRFATATPTGGGATVPSKLSTGYGASAFSDIRFVDTGLTTTSVTVDTDAFYITALPRSVTSTSVAFQMDFENLERQSPFVIASGEGILIRLMNTAVVGDGITGSICWNER